MHFYVYRSIWVAVICKTDKALVRRHTAHVIESAFFGRESLSTLLPENTGEAGVADTRTLCPTIPDYMDDDIPTTSAGQVGSEMVTSWWWFPYREFVDDSLEIITPIVHLSNGHHVACVLSNCCKTSWPRNNNWDLIIIVVVVGLTQPTLLDNSLFSCCRPLCCSRGQNCNSFVLKGARGAGATTLFEKPARYFGSVSCRWR